jgi:hypothetical protein
MINTEIERIDEISILKSPHAVKLFLHRIWVKNRTYTDAFELELFESSRVEPNRTEPRIGSVHDFLKLAVSGLDRFGLWAHGSRISAQNRKPLNDMKTLVLRVYTSAIVLTNSGTFVWWNWVRSKSKNRRAPFQYHRQSNQKRKKGIVSRGFSHSLPKWIGSHNIQHLIFPKPHFAIFGPHLQFFIIFFNPRLVIWQKSWLSFNL